jgi:hypothetical protein
MTKLYLKRDYGLGETYIIREVEDHHLSSYQYEQRNIDCKKCKKKITILCSNGQFSKFSEMFCPGCVDRRTEAYIAAAPKSVGFATKNIPSWRLDMEGATPEDILTRSEGDFKVPYKSHQEWQEYYQSPHELKRQREFEKNQRQESDQLLRSLG